MNKLLKRQIEKHLGENYEINTELKSFFSAISDAYDSFDDDKKMTERSLELSSNELLENNRQLHDDAEKQKEALYNIRSVISELIPNQNREKKSLSSEDEIVSLSKYLKKIMKEQSEKVDEVEKLNDIMVGRELKMIELKKKIVEYKKAMVQKKENIA